MNTKHTPLQSPVLKDIISAYADLWADVMLGKNLESHLKNIDSDLQYLDVLIAIREKEGANNQRIIKVANQLYCMKMIVLKKLKLRK